MRKRALLLLLAFMAIAMFLASGVALAVTRVGGPGPDTLTGTNGSDKLLGRGAATGSRAEAVRTLYLPLGDTKVCAVDASLARHLWLTW